MRRPGRRGDRSILHIRSKLRKGIIEIAAALVGSFLSQEAAPMVSVSGQGNSSWWAAHQGTFVTRCDSYVVDVCMHATPPTWVVVAWYREAYAALCAVRPWSSVVPVGRSPCRTEHGGRYGALELLIR